MPETLKPCLKCGATTAYLFGIRTCTRTHRFVDNCPGERRTSDRRTPAAQPTDVGSLADRIEHDMNAAEKDGFRCPGCGGTWFGTSYYGQPNQERYCKTPESPGCGWHGPEVKARPRTAEVDLDDLREAVAALRTRPALAQPAREPDGLRAELARIATHPSVRGVRGAEAATYCIGWNDALCAVLSYLDRLTTPPGEEKSGPVIGTPAGTTGEDE